jgi:precorrin-6B methylase 2
MTASAGVSPDLFLDQLLGFQKTAALKAAIALDVFSAIGKGSETAGSIALRARAAEHGIRILCDFLTVNGHLEKHSDRYRLTGSSAMFLDRASPACLLDIATFLASPEVIANYLDDPVSFVRNGGSVGLAIIAPENESWVTFAKAMVPFMAPVAQGVAAAVAAFPRRPRRVLDIAAGHGMFGITIARQSPDARLVALDWPNVLAVARENAAKAGIGERFDTIAGSAFDVDWGRDYDLVLLPNFLHHFDRSANESLLRRAREALAPDGRVLVVEMVPNDDRVSPPFPATFAYMMLGGTPHGDAYTLAEFEAMGTAAGFTSMSSQPLPPSPQTMIVFS